MFKGFATSNGCIFLSGTVKPSALTAYFSPESLIRSPGTRAPHLDPCMRVVVLCFLPLSFSGDNTTGIVSLLLLFLVSKESAVAIDEEDFVKAFTDVPTVQVQNKAKEFSIHPKSFVKQNRSKLPFFADLLGEGPRGQPQQDPGDLLR